MKHYFQAIGKGQVIDTDEGVIRACSLIQAGPAEGHFDKKGRQETVDETTLSQVFAYCKGAESIKVKVDHGSGVMSTVGYMDNFCLTANKVLGDFHIYDTADEKARIMEVAAKNPHHMGMSLEFEGKDEAKDGKSYSRCERVLAVALVSDPAANSSLFSALPPEETEKQTNTTMAENDPTETKPSVEDQLSELAKKFEDLSAKYAAKFGADEPDGDEPEAPDAPDAPPATDPEKEPAGSDPEKTYSEEEKDAEVKKAAEFAADRVLKQFAAKFGVTALGKPGSAGSAAKEKHFEEHVADLSVKEFSGDQNKARVAILTNKSKYPDAWKSYEASRNVKHI